MLFDCYRTATLSLFFSPIDFPPDLHNLIYDNLQMGLKQSYQMLGHNLSTMPAPPLPPL